MGVSVSYEERFLGILKFDDAPWKFVFIAKDQRSLSYLFRFKLEKEIDIGGKYQITKDDFLSGVSRIYSNRNVWLRRKLN